LKSKQLAAEYQKETDQLYILFKVHEQEFPLFIRIFEGGELLQLLAFLPCNTTKESLNDTARLLHLLNKELDTPGFGMDESSSVVFYRLMMPIQNRTVDTRLLEAYIGVIQMVCKTFASVITAVALNAVTFEEVLTKAREAGSQQGVAQAMLNKKKS
jgi:hypothetical protein